LPTAQNLHSASRGGVYRNSIRGGLPAGLVAWFVCLWGTWSTGRPLSRASSLPQLIRVCLREIGRLAGRLRRQASSHRDWGHLQKPGRLSGRHREQARSHRKAKSRAAHTTASLLTTHQAER